MEIHFLQLSPSADVDYDECYTYPRGDDYRGYVSMTKSGRTCQNWLEQAPHEHGFQPENYPFTGLGDHNFCRNPDGEPSPWCYTTDPNKRWELCNVGEPNMCGTGSSKYELLRKATIR